MIYPFCLPFDVNLKEMEANDDCILKAYQMKYIKDDKEVVFAEVSGQLKAGEPYLIVVDGGGFIIEQEKKTKISNKQGQGVQVLKIKDGQVTNEVAGIFKGEFERISSPVASALNMYIQQASGSWNRALDLEKYKSWRSYAFRSFFYLTSEFKRNSYANRSVKTTAGARSIDGNHYGDESFEEFPAEAYFSDGEFDDDETTGIAPFIHTIDLDGTERYYDMNGRQLTGKPQKGVFIKNGKKYINK